MDLNTGYNDFSFGGEVDPADLSEKADRASLKGPEASSPEMRPSVTICEDSSAQAR